MSKKHEFYSRLVSQIHKTKFLIPVLVGDKGGGKNTFVRDFAESNLKTLAMLNLSACDSTDLTGVPSVVDGKTTYARPYFYDAGVIFFDEIDRISDRSVRSSLLTLITERELNGHKLSDDTLIIGAGNGNSGQYETVEFDVAMKDRISIIPFSYSVEDKLDYLAKKYEEQNSLFWKYINVDHKIFSALSSRRIEAGLMCYSDSFMEALNYIIGDQYYALFKKFKEESLYTLQNILDGKYKPEKLTALTRRSLAMDMGNDFLSLDPKYAENINKFLNLCSPEELARFFSKLRKLCVDQTDKFHVSSKKLAEAGAFKGFKDFLKEFTA